MNVKGKDLQTTTSVGWGGGRVKEIPDAGTVETGDAFAIKWRSQMEMDPAALGRRSLQRGGHDKSSVEAPR